MNLTDKILIRLDDLDYSRESHSISKYYPCNYTEDGHYSVSEWTSYHDIGKNYDGKVFTLEDSLRCEDRYVNAIVEIALMLKISFFTIGYLEPITETGKRKGLSPEMYALLTNLKVGKRLNISQTAVFIRLLLRDACWGVIVNERQKTQISMGYDFYLNIHTSLPNEVLVEIVHSNKLFVDRN